MTGDPVLAELEECGVVPVVVLDRLEDAVPLARALLAGGLRALELTLRTPVALPALRLLASEPGLSGLVLGAGTVRTVQEAVDVVAAGARFVVSPGFDRGVLEVCAAADVTALPGVATATELLRAQHAGVSVVKFFPAEAIGGLSALSALAGPFFDMRFLPTGGVTAPTAATYLRHEQVVAVGGSWMVPSEAVEAGDWRRINALASECAAMVQDVRSSGDGAVG